MGTDIGQAVGAPRVDWVDYAKGFCIIMVVMMHSTLGVEAAAGHESWMHALVAFAKPFRMPDFFLISGLFLARVIDRDWRTYLDRKVVHFAYFYLLPIFFVLTKLTRGVPVIVVWTVLAALEIAHIQTGWTAIDEFANRFVYFYTGYVLASRIFAIATAVQARPVLAALGLAAWAAFNGFYVALGIDGKPFISLTLGLIGSVAVVAASALMATRDVFAPLRTLGRNSIVVYLAFFLGMAVSRAVLLKTGIIPDLGTAALLVTACGIGGAVALFWAVRGTPLKFLFERPRWARLRDKPRYALQPAE